MGIIATRSRFVVFLIFFLFGLASADERYTPVVKAVRQVEGAVVNIRAETVKQRRAFQDPFFDEFFGGGSYKSQSLGTGVIINPQGLIVTNYHVIDGAVNIEIFTPEGRKAGATYIGGDAALDIALLKIENMTNLTAARLGNSRDLLTGETVIAIGNPYGLSSSVTTGVISNTRRVIKIDSSFAVFIQTDALINPGNSGGPLVNINGDVIGINSAIYKEAQGIGFAIPIDAVKRIVPELLTYKRVRRGYLGFSFSHTSSDGTGLVLDSVTAGSEAYILGLAAGDVLLSLDDIPVSTAQGADYILRTFPPGERLPLLIQKRGGVIRELQLTLKEMPKGAGVHILRQKYGIELLERAGVLEFRRSNFPRYIAQGDVLTAVNGRSVKILSDLDDIIENEFTPLKIRVSSNRGTLELTLN